jgi:hypothetical protein
VPSGEEAEKRIFDERVNGYAPRFCSDMFPAAKKVTFTCKELTGSSRGGNNDARFIEINAGHGRKVEKLDLRTPKPEKLLLLLAG